MRQLRGLLIPHAVRYLTRQLGTSIAALQRRHRSIDGVEIVMRQECLEPLPPSNADPDMVKANPGPIFEQWVGIELWNRLQYLGNGRLFHQRSRDGAEVDFIIERGNRLTPIEVKWTEHPTLSDARHLLAFLREKPKEAKDGYVICRCPRPLQLHERITALPWFCL